MPKKKKSQIEEKTKKLNDKQSSNRKLNYDKKVDLKSKEMKNKEGTKISNHGEKIEKKRN